MCKVNQNQCSEKLSRKDIYNRLWKGRDFEIEHLWQRSIFLGAFLILFFTVYFTTLGTIFSKAESPVTSQPLSIFVPTSGTCLNTYGNSSKTEFDFLNYLSHNKVINICLLSIALLGFCFSILWILMAKGSKYWYEKYESSIDHMQNNDNLYDEDIKESREDDIADIPVQGFLQCGKSDDSVFSHKGGAYSMSKVNISIGQIFAIFWTLSIIFHFYLLANSNFQKIVFLFIAIALIFFVIILLGCTNRSGEADSSCLFRVLGIKCGKNEKYSNVQNQQGKQ